jgi:hypothetical protein
MTSVDIREIGGRRHAVVTMSAAGDQRMPLETLREQGHLEGGSFPRSPDDLSHTPVRDFEWRTPWGLSEVHLNAPEPPTPRVSLDTILEGTTDAIYLLKPEDFRTLFVDYVSEVEQDNADLDNLRRWADRFPYLKAALMKKFPELKAAWGPMPVTIEDNAGEQI